MLRVIDNKKNISLKKVADKEWQFIYKKSLNSLMNRLYDACDLMDNGFYEKAIPILREIIEKEPTFVDAYNQLGLALAWSGLEEEGQLILEQGIENILSLFPPNFFEDQNLLEWGWLDNRSFLRCYGNLGLCYLDNKRYDKAKLILERILVMNPNDNQGMRDPLLSCYFLLGNLEAAFDLCNRYKEDVLVAITYGRALLLFKQGKKEEAEKQFIKAMRFSPRVAKELIKPKHIKPKDYAMGPGIVVGGQEEAYEYWLSFGQFWKTTPGTLPFIKSCLAKFKKIKVDSIDDEDDQDASTY